jgi:hypothetical protein
MTSQRSGAEIFLLGVAALAMSASIHLHFCLDGYFAIARGHSGHWPNRAPEREAATL